MKILILGSGGREHALGWKLAQENEVIIAPGNGGIARSLTTAALDLADPIAVTDLATRHAIDLVVIGPEDPLIAGLADALRCAGFATFGPGKLGAQLEGSKAFSKQLMAQAGVPTASFDVATSLSEALMAIKARFVQGRQVAVKASGAALGKGVVVCESEVEAIEAASMMLARNELGEAGRTVVIEDRLTGFEFSLLTLVSEAGIWSLPVAQDYKRIFDQDHGPNTGGMGTYSPIGHVSDALVKECEDRIVHPLIKEMSRNSIPYRGVLFSGIMMEGGVPLCLEYNVRFGDPETQTVVRRLGKGLAESLLAVAQGGAPPPIEVLSPSAVTVVIASRGYPGSAEKGVPIQIGVMPEGVVAFHAGTGVVDGELVTAGGRVLGISATGATLFEARALAYDGVKAVSFDGMQFRADIAGV